MPVIFFSFHDDSPQRLSPPQRGMEEANSSSARAAAYGSFNPLTTDSMDCCTFGRKANRARCLRSSVRKWRMEKTPVGRINIISSDMPKKESPPGRKGVSLTMNFGFGAHTCHGGMQVQDTSRRYLPRDEHGEVLGTERIGERNNPNREQERCTQPTPAPLKRLDTDLR